jgi:TonB family protein
MILALASAAALVAHAGGATPAQRARANLNGYFSADDYPEAALRQHAQGTTAFSLDIDPEGAITRCTITHSSGDASLDAATCSILVSRVRYQPARDRRGRAVAGSDNGRVTWRLPPLPPFRPERSVSVLRSDGTGGLTCAVTINGAPQQDVPPERCGPLGRTGADRILRQMRTPTEVTAIVMTGPADAGIERVDADEASLGTLQFDVVAEFPIQPDGRVGGCQTIRRNIVEAAAASVAPDFCARRAATDGPMFEASTGRAARVARYRAALYVKGERLPYGNPAGRPRANLNSYFSTDDYPAEALRAGAEGTVQFRLEIDTEGRVSRCNLVRSSGNASLDARTCEVLISRARYEPARNAAGEAIPGTDEGRVTWRLPEPAEADAEPYSEIQAPARIELTFGKDDHDRPICATRLNGGPGGAGGAAICTALRGNADGVLARLPRNSAVTLDVALSLDGHPVPPAAIAGSGTLLVDATADLAIDPEGRVSACTVRQTNYHGNMEAGLSVAPICDFPGFQGPVFPKVPDNGTPRHGQIRLELYLRTGPAQSNT